MQGKNLFVIGKNKKVEKDLLLLDSKIVNNWFYEIFFLEKVII